MTGPLLNQCKGVGPIAKRRNRTSLAAVLILLCFGGTLSIWLYANVVLLTPQSPYEIVHRMNWVPQSSICAN
jgi:hypothetical protein